MKSIQMMTKKKVFDLFKMSIYQNQLIGKDYQQCSLSQWWSQSVSIGSTITAIRNHAFAPCSSFKLVSSHCSKSTDEKGCLIDWRSVCCCVSMRTRGNGWVWPSFNCFIIICIEFNENNAFAEYSSNESIPHSSLSRNIGTSVFSCYWLMSDVICSMTTRTIENSDYASSPSLTFASSVTAIGDHAIPSWSSVGLVSIVKKEWEHAETIALPSSSLLRLVLHSMHKWKNALGLG